MSEHSSRISLNETTPPKSEVKISKTPRKSQSEMNSKLAEIVQKSKVDTIEKSNIKLSKVKIADSKVENNSQESKVQVQADESNVKLPNVKSNNTVALIAKKSNITLMSSRFNENNDGSTSILVTVKKNPDPEISPDQKGTKKIGSFEIKSKNDDENFLLFYNIEAQQSKYWFGDEFEISSTYGYLGPNDCAKIDIALKDTLYTYFSNPKKVVKFQVKVFKISKSDLEKELPKDPTFLQLQVFWDEFLIDTKRGFETEFHIVEFKGIIDKHHARNNDEFQNYNEKIEELKESVESLHSNIRCIACVMMLLVLNQVSQMLGYF